jgi:nucleoside recognition membrane protein YjiH
MMMGAEFGSEMRRKIWKKPAPSIIAALASSVGNVSE